MSKKIRFYWVHNGTELVPAEEGRWKKFQRSLQAGDKLESVFSFQEKEISHDFFGYYFGFLIKRCGIDSGAEFFRGYSEKEIDDLFRETFLSFSYVQIVNNKPVIKKSKRLLQNLTASERAEFIQRIHQFYSEEGLDVSLFDKKIEEKYKTINLKD